MFPNAHAGLDEEITRMREEIRYLQNELSNQKSLMSEMNQKLSNQSIHLQMCLSKTTQLESNLGNLDTQISRQKQSTNEMWQTVNEIIKAITPVPVRKF